MEKAGKTDLLTDNKTNQTFQTIAFKYVDYFYDHIMNDSNRSKLFEKTLKKAKEGDLYNYDSWLISHRIDPKKIRLNYIKNQFIKNPEFYIGNDQDLLVIAEKIGLFLSQRPKSYQIPIIGCKGFGKSLFISLIFKLGSTNAPINMEKRFVLESFFGRKKHPGAMYSQTPHTAVRLLDDCGEYTDIIYTINNVIKNEGDALFITIWNPENWLYIYEIFKDELPFEDIIILKPFSEGELSTFLDGLFNLILISGEQKEKSIKMPDLVDYEKFSKENIVNILIKFTLGIPMVTADLLFRCFKIMFKMEKTVLDGNIIKLAAEKMDLENQNKKIDELTPQHIKFLKRLLLDKNGDGTRPIDLLEEFNLDKSTISYHLSKLVDKEIIEVNKMGKSSFYRVKNHLIPFIQLKLLNKIDLKKQFIKEE